MGGRTLPVTVSATGTYSLDLSGVVDLVPGSLGTVTYTDAEGNQVRVHFAGPYLSVTLGMAAVNGTAPGGLPVTLTLYAPNGEVKGTGRVDPAYTSWFYASLADSQGDPVAVAAGDRLRLQSPGGVLSMTVPTLSVAFDRERHVLTGVAPAGGWLEVLLASFNRRVQTAPDGTWGMDWADVEPRPGDRGEVHYADEHGNRTALPFEIPYYRAFLPLLPLDTPGHSW